MFLICKIIFKICKIIFKIFIKIFIKIKLIKIESSPTGGTFEGTAFRCVTHWPIWLIIRGNASPKMALGRKTAMMPETLATCDEKH